MAEGKKKISDLSDIELAAGLAEISDRIKNDNRIYNVIVMEIDKRRQKGNSEQKME